MKIVNNPSLKEEINRLLDNDELNLSISDMFVYALSNHFKVDKKEVEILKDKYQARAIDIYKDKLLEFWDIEDNEDELINRYVLSSIKESDINKYLNNPYYKNIKINDIKVGNYELVKDHYSAYELFPYQDIEIEKDSYIELNSMSFFLEEYPFIALNYKKETWMAITPNEIETMEKSIEEAHDKVLVCGLGLGYYPYMISLKENVKEITIVDNDPTIIKLFKENILPQFENKKKIKIIDNDAFNILKSEEHFDYVFIDLWHNPLDGIELYLKCKKLEKKDTTYSYWLESSFIALLRRCMFTLIKEQLEGYSDNQYHKAETYTDYIINQYYTKTKNTVISSIEELHDIISDNKLINYLI